MAVEKRFRQREEKVDKKIPDTSNLVTNTTSNTNWVSRK